MVKKIKKTGSDYFQCSDCGMFYKSEGWARKCEQFCRKHKQCNLEIIKHAIDV